MLSEKGSYIKGASLMGKKRMASLENEYALERQIKDLKAQIEKLKKQLKESEKTSEPKTEKSKPVLERVCTGCGGKVKEMPVPNVGILELCASGCGHRNIRKTK